MCGFLRFDSSQPPVTILRSISPGDFVLRVSVNILVPFAPGTSVRIGSFTDPDLFFGPGDVAASAADDFSSDVPRRFTAADSLILSFAAPSGAGEGLIYFETR